MSDPSSTLSPNAHQYAVAALRERRSRVAGELLHLEGQARLRREALAHLDAVLRMFAPEADPAALPTRRARPEEPYAVPALTRRVLDVLRRHGAPMASMDVADSVAAEMGFDDEGARAIRDRVNHALRHLHTTGDRPVLKAGMRADAMWSLR